MTSGPTPDPPERGPAGHPAPGSGAADRERTHPGRSTEGEPGSGSERRGLQRGVIILPSAFTLGNLFFGIYSIVAAFRGDVLWASWFVVVAAILDMLDGRVARFTRTGSTFGSELDSLVDAVSFGVAPGFLIYTLYFQEGPWSWLIAFVYIAAVVVRLARFNVEQAGRAKSHFHGLPSPTAGMILATFYPFSQTAFFQANLSGIPWPQVLAVSTVLISVLMLSHVPYPVVPRIGFRSARGILTTGLFLGGLFAAITVPRYFFFPLLVLYTTWGLLKSVLLGLVERLPERDPLRDEHGAEADEADAEVRTLDYSDLAPGRYPAAGTDEGVNDRSGGNGGDDPREAPADEAGEEKASDDDRRVR